jgi:chromosome segregation ATPase
MGAQTAPAQFTVVADAGIYKEIENTIDALDRLKDAIVEFKKKRTDAEAELANSLGKDLSSAPLNVEKAIAQLNAEKAKVEVLNAKIASAEELQVIIQAMIDELKATQSEALKVVLHRKLEQLEAEVAAEEDKEAALKEQIDALKALLDEVEGKPPYSAAARRKKK